MPKLAFVFVALKSCHTAELPYVFESMEIIRSNYSTLSEYAQKEAPAAPEYPYTDILAAFRGVLEEQSDEFEDSNQRREDTANTNNQAHMKNNTRAFQRILTHFFGDYFREDADEEIASDMAERWVAFARSGDPNYVDSKVKWIPWRYIPSEDLARNDMDFEDYLPWESDEQLPEFWTDDDDDEEEEASYYMSGQTKSPEGFLWADDRGGRAYRKRALRAMNMAVAEEDILRTELSRTIREPDLSFALKFLSNFGITTHKGEERMPLRTIRQVQRIAQEMGVLGTGLRSDDHGRRSGSSGLNNWNENFFPQLLELKWPPEERLVERDCTCDFWEKIRCTYLVCAYRSSFLFYTDIRLSFHLKRSLLASDLLDRRIGLEFVSTRAAKKEHNDIATHFSNREISHTGTSFVDFCRCVSASGYAVSQLRKAGNIPLGLNL